jgi:hypothetical protein
MKTSSPAKQFSVSEFGELEDIFLCIDGLRYPVKRVAGQLVDFRADVFFVGMAGRD